MLVRYEPGHGNHSRLGRHPNTGAGQANVGTQERLDPVAERGILGFVIGDDGSKLLRVVGGECRKAKTDESCHGNQAGNKKNLA